MAIHDNTFPYLVPVIDSLSQPLPWAYGNMLNVLSQTHFVRFSVRGILFSRSPLAGVASSHWHKMQPCVPSRSSLCSTNENLSFFSTKEVDIADSWANMTMNAFTALALSEGSCQSSSSGRSVRVGDTKYEVSLCDIYDLNMHFVYNPSEQTMLYRQDESSVFELIVIALVSIFFISALSHNLISIFSPTQEAHDVKIRQARLQAAVVTLTWAYYVYFFSYPGADMLLTATDITLAVQICLFILVEAVGQIVVAQLQHDPMQDMSREAQLQHDPMQDMSRDDSTWTYLSNLFSIPVHPDGDGYVSILTASLLLLSCRLHFTFDTPYLNVLAIVFGTRSFYKLFRVLDGRTAGRNGRALFIIEYLLQVFDMYLFASLLGNGVALATPTNLDGLLALQLTAFFSLCCGCLLWLIRKAQALLHTHSGLQDA